MNIRIKKLHPAAALPTYAHGPFEDAGMDLCAIEDVYLPANVPMLLKTGLSIELPPGFEGQIRPRSGLALKHGITVLNSPGTVDPSYRGELGVILLWDGYNPNTRYTDMYSIKTGDRIAQLVVARYEPIKWEMVTELEDSTRGSGGFGSTGLQTLK